MEKDFITSENALDYLKQIRDTMISERCNIREASEKVGVKKTDLDNYMKQYHKSDEYMKVEEEITTLNADLTCSKYVKLRLEGNPAKGYAITGKQLEELYETTILPSLTLTREALDEYKEQRPLLDFEAVAEYHEKQKSGELYRGSIIDRLNSILSSGDRKTLSNIKSQISQYELLKKDEEIIELLGKIDELYKKQIIEKLKKAISDNNMKAMTSLKAKMPHTELFRNDEEIIFLMSKIDEATKKEAISKSIPKYIHRWASHRKVEGVSANLNSLVLEIASLSDEKIKEEYPGINIGYLRIAANRISQLQGETKREQESSHKAIEYTKIEEEKEKIRSLKEIANGNFIINNITTQEQFDIFLAGIPDTFTRIRKRAQDMWDKYNEYKEYDINKLEEKRAELETEYRYAKTYKRLVDEKIMVDYYKLKKKPIEQLFEIEKIASENTSNYLNNNEQDTGTENPFWDIIIDDEARDDYSKDFQEDRIKRANSFLYQLEGELDLVNSVIDFKKKEKEERLNEEQVEEEKINDDTEEIKDVEDMTQNIENSVEPEKNEENFESLSNEELLALQESLDTKIDDTESQISALQTSIEEVDNQIKSEKEKQEAEKRKQLIESIKRNRKIVQDGNAKIGSLRGELATKQQELNSLLENGNLIEGEKTKDE